MLADRDKKMSQNLTKKLCLQKPIYNSLLDEIRVIKNIVDFRISAVESKIDLLVRTCSSIFSNTEISKSNHNDNISSINDVVNQFLLKIGAVEEIIAKLEFNLKDKPCRYCNSSGNSKSQSGPNFINHGEKLILNSIDDFPNGSWLGNDLDPQRRVRVNIEPSVLLHINEQCTTPEKMALTLIDTLFPREVLAISNLSGKGKHCKQQLDPLLIYGIKCHLKYKFDITESDWFRIKRNIDSKCRTIWRRKKRGLPLGNQKASSNQSNIYQNDFNDYDSSDECLEQVVCYEVSDTQKVNDIPTGGDLNLSVSKPSSEDDFQLLPSVQLFTVEAADCFMLQENELIIPDGINQHDFLNK